MWKLIFIDETHPLLAAELTKAGCRCDHVLVEPKKTVAQLLPQYDGLICKSRFVIDKAFLKHGVRLKFIARAGVGTDHIDLKYAKEKGIRVFTSPEGSMDTVAEHAMGLLLMLMNNLGKAQREIASKRWLRKENTGVEIKGKTVGILGYGNMGRSFARRLSGFKTKRVIAYDKFKTNYGDRYAEAVSLRELFAEADILSIHIFYTPDNHYFINKEFINKFKKPIWLVNTARGLVLNTSDLIACLQSGKIKGAALDVLEYEEISFERMNFEKLPPEFFRLVEADNVVLSPHIAGWSVESHEGHARSLAHKIRAFLSSVGGKR